MTTCPYCGVGCGVRADVGADGQVSIAASQTHPANLGRLCVKGTNLAATTGPDHRLLQPQIAGEPADWDSALTLMAERFRDTINRHGPDSVAFYLSGQLLTEDYYVANKLMKGFLGSGNVDTNSRLCMASAVASYKRAFGSDAVPCNYEDLETCDLLVITGSNAAWTHPILFQRVSAAKARRPQMRVVVIDPRHTATCDIADLHLQINPGSDGYLFNGLFNFLAHNGGVDADFVRQHTESFEATAQASADCHMKNVMAATGLNENALQSFFDCFSDSARVVTFYSQGINQSATGTDKCNAIINCHLATGQVGKPGSGPFSITGQPNAMGGREVGGLSNQLAAHMDFVPADIDRVRRFWNAPAMASRPGLKAVELFDGMLDGRIKAVWIMATNPAVSLPDSMRVRRALQACDFVVVSDCVANTDTNAYADVLLPATAWGEKNGTVTNSERRISRQRAFLPPAGDSRHDWEIICDFAGRMGFAGDFAYAGPDEIFREHAQLSAFENDGSRLFNLAGLARLDADGYDGLQPVQWPVLSTPTGGTARLFGDGRFNTPSQRARFVPVLASMPQERGPATKEKRYVLNSGRLRDQWHTMTRTGQVAKLLKHSDSPRLSLSPLDFNGLQLTANDLVRITADTGAACMIPVVDPGLQPGNVFVPIHWTDQFAGKAVVSALFDAVTDPHSGQPQSKWGRVGLERIPVACWSVIVCAQPLDLSGSSYWHRVEQEGHCLYQLAATDFTSLDNPFWHALRQRYPQADTVTYMDTQRGEHGGLLFADGRLVAAQYVTGERARLPERDWLATLPGQIHGTDSWLLLGGRNFAVPARGKLICSCHEVAQSEIVAAIGAGANSVEELGERLQCGTNCGSCIPELKQLLKQAQSGSDAFGFMPARRANG